MKVNITDYGAACDGVTDDRAAIQAAIIAAGPGGTVTAPAATCLVARGAGFFALGIVNPVTLDMPGTTFLMDRSTAQADTKLLEIEAADVTIIGLTLVGQRLATDVGEHRHGINASGAPRLTLRDVTARGFVGDGIYLYNGCDDATIGVTCTDNGRNGLTLGGTMSRVRVTGCRFAGNVAQQFDSEAPSGHQDDVTISGCTFDTLGVSDQYVLTISGSSAAVRSKRWLVERNVINGGVLVVWGEGTRILRNVGVNPTRQSSVRVYRACEDTLIAYNELTATQAALSGVGVVSVSGSAGGPPRHTRIAHNVLRATGAIATNGIRAEGAASLELVDNELAGPGFASAAGNSAGIYLRATLADPALAWDWAVVRGNRLAGWGATGLVVQGNGAAPLGMLDVADNLFVDAATMSAALSLDDGTGCALDVRQSGNLALGAVTALVRTPATGARSAWGDGDRWLKP